MADPEADGCDVDEAPEALGGLVVTGGGTAGVFQPVEVPLDQVARVFASASVTGGARVPMARFRLRRRRTDRPSSR